MMRLTHFSRPPGKMLGGLLLLLVLVSLPLRAEEPTPTKAFYNTFTDEEEMAMGRKAAEETDKQMALLDSPLLTAYLNNLGQKVAQASRRPQIQYSFKIVNTDTVNAFSLPGGFIYVNRGLLDFVVNESELAGVLAHEVGHVVAYHSMNDVARRYWSTRECTNSKRPACSMTSRWWICCSSTAVPCCFSSIANSAARKNPRLTCSACTMPSAPGMTRKVWFPPSPALANFTGNPTLVEGLLMNHPLPGERVKALRAELQQNPAPKGLEKDSMAFRAAKVQLKALPAPPPHRRKSNRNGIGRTSGVARSAENSRRKSNEGPKQFEHSPDGNSHQPEGQGQNPNQRIEHQRQKRQRPAKKKKNAPEQEFHHESQLPTRIHAHSTPGCNRDTGNVIQERSGRGHY